MVTTGDEMWDEPTGESRVWWYDEETMDLITVGANEQDNGVFVRFRDGFVAWLDMEEWLPEVDQKEIYPVYVGISPDFTELIVPAGDELHRIPGHWIRMICEGKARFRGEAWSYEMAEMWGLRIRQARSRLGWHQAELARRAGTSQSAISRLERGVHIPHFRTLERIAASMGQTPFEMAICYWKHRKIPARPTDSRR